MRSTPKIRLSPTETRNTERGITEPVEDGQDGKSRVHGDLQESPSSGPKPEDGDRRYCLKIGTSILTKSGLSVFSQSTDCTPAGLVITFGSKIIMLSSSLKS